jgi:hypothetical protein
MSGTNSVPDLQLPPLATRFYASLRSNVVFVGTGVYASSFKFFNYELYPLFILNFFNNLSEPSLDT